MNARIGLTGLLLALSYRPLMGQQSVTLLQPNTVLTVDSGSKSASGMLHLRNAGPKKAAVNISAGEFINRTTQKGINAKTTFFGPNDSTGKQVLKIEMPAESLLHVRAEVSNLWEAGESEAAVLANGDTIGTLRAIKYRVPFNVRLRGSTTDPPELAFTRGTDFLLDLKNDDGMTYTVAPALWMKGRSHEGGTVVLPPNGNGTVKVSPPGAWFRGVSFLKADQAEGVLTLRLNPPGTQSDAGWPTKTIPFKARLSKLTPGWQSTWGFIYVFVLVALGALTSLVLRYWVPNSLATASLKDRLNEVAEKTRMLSGRTSSEIRVGLGVERQRLIERLKRRWTFSPELPAIATEIGKRVDELLSHLGLVGRLNDLRARVDDLYKEEAPSRVSLIEDEVDAIAASLKKIPATPEELQAIDTKISAIGGKIDLLTQSDDEWVKKLEAEFTELNTSRQALESGYPECKGLFLPWNRVWKGIPPAEYDALDGNISLLKLVREYLDLPPAPSGTKSGEGARKDFKRAVEGCNFRQARKAIRELRSRNYREEVVAALQDDTQRPRLLVTPQAPRVYSPVQFTLEFPDRRLTNSDALDPVLCQWDFRHDELTEKGWRVAHYFPKKGDYAVRVTFEYEGQPVRENGKSVEITKKIVTKEPTDEKNRRTQAELVQVGIVVLIALLGLMAGAREQLEKLDLVAASVAVFLLGFSADSIKNALAPPKTTA